MNVIKFILITSLLVFFQSCSGDNIFSNSDREQGIDKQEVIEVVQSEDPVVIDTDGITIHIASQIIETTYKHYKEMGMTEANLNDMPASEFTDNLKKLYYDLKPIMENGEQ